MDLLDSLVPNILALVLAAWEGMPQPAPDALEDPISETLCRHLRQGRDRCSLPFNVYTQLVELEPVAGQDQGRLDIAFAPHGARESIYFCLECKRLNVADGDGVRPYSSEYVRFGMLRFVHGQYAAMVRNGGMLAYVLDGNATKAMANVEANIRARQAELGMAPPGAFLPSSTLPGDPRARETRHRRSHSASQFVIHHLFMPRNPPPPVPPPAPAGKAKPPAPAKPRRKPGGRGGKSR
jgi:hypothetical protein